MVLGYVYDFNRFRKGRMMVLTSAITVKLYGSLVKYAPNQENLFIYELSGEISISSLIENIGIPKSISLTCAVNGQKESENYILVPGDTVFLFPPITGG
jgi:molybdopterin converting factor small subunit